MLLSPVSLPPQSSSKRLETGAQCLLSLGKVTLLGLYKEMISKGVEASNQFSNPNVTQEEPQETLASEI